MRLYVTRRDSSGRMTRRRYPSSLVLSYVHCAKISQVPKADTSTKTSLARYWWGGTIKNVMTSNDAIVFAHGTTSHPSQLLHMSTHPQQQSQMHTKRTNIRPSLTTHPKHSQPSLIIKFQQLTLMNSSNPQLSLHRRNKRRSLKQRPCQILNGPRQRSVGGKRVVQAEDTDVFFSGGLLRFYE